MKIRAFFCLFTFLVSLICAIGCSSNGTQSPITPQDDEIEILQTEQSQGSLGNRIADSPREIVGIYEIEIIQSIQRITLEPTQRISSYHFNLTNLRPNVLAMTSFGNDPSHNNDFYVDLRLSHPYPESGIDGFDPRVIAVLPANSPSNTIEFPHLQVTTNYRVVMEPDGYTKLFDNLGLAGNTNPFKCYFKEQLHRRWSSTGPTRETIRWYIDLKGFENGIRFYLVCDVSTGFPNLPTPIDHNAPEPVMIETTIGEGLCANGGYADVNVRILDWQGPDYVIVQMECPQLFDSLIDLDYVGPGVDPYWYAYAGEIGNFNSAPAGEYYCLVSAFDGFGAIGIYTLAKAVVSSEIVPVVNEAYYDFSTIDIKTIHLVGSGFGNAQGTSEVLVDGSSSGFVIANWDFYEIILEIANDNLDHSVQLNINGHLLDEINLLESSTILLVYNSNNADSTSIKDYYASETTGRNIDEPMILGLPLSLGEAITRTQYDNQIKTPIEDYILSNNLMYRIKYIVLANGIPLKIIKTGGSDYTDLDYAAVDSELTLIFNTSYALPGRFSNPFYGRVYNMYFHPFKYKIGNTKMAYLVTRLAAWTLDEVYGMIDRGLNGYSGNAAYGILDGDPGKWYDRMEAAESQYISLGIQHLYDNTNVFLTAATIANPDISDNVLGYTGHGVHHNSSPPGGGLYVYELGFELLNGAIFNTYESFNCTTFIEANRSGHGMVGDWIRIGGTGGIGHVYEPWSDAVGDERFLYPAQVFGNNLAEACYIACRYLSWTETIVGDPLCLVDVY